MLRLCSGYGLGEMSGCMMNRIVLMHLMTLIKKDRLLRQEGKRAQKN